MRRGAATLTAMGAGRPRNRALVFGCGTPVQGMDERQCRLVFLLPAWAIV